MNDVKQEIIELLEQRRFEEAGELLMKCQETHEHDIDVWTLTATFFILQGNDPAAEDALLVAYKRAPEAFVPRFMLADVYERSGLLGQALKWYRKAQEVAPAEAVQQVEEALSRLQEQGVTDPSERKRLAILVRQGLDQFLDDLVRELQVDYDVRKIVVSSLKQVDEAMEWADICWFEWCDELLVHGSRLELARQKPLVCRLHRYEAFTDKPARVQWETVDTLILVAEHMRSLVANVVPDIERRVPIEVVHNGVNLNRYPLRERGPGHRIACVGYLHMRKNPVLLLQVLKRLVEVDARYALYVAGRFQDPLLELYWEYQIREMGLSDHVHFEGWQDDVASWLADKDYLLSTSIHESFGYAIAEAMSMGIKPVVHNFLGARDIWPVDILFNTVEEAVAMIRQPLYASDAYRRYVEEHYSLDHQVARIREILKGLPEQKAQSGPIPPIFRKGALHRMVEQVIALEEAA